MSGLHKKSLINQVLDFKAGWNSSIQIVVVPVDAWIYRYYGLQRWILRLGDHRHVKEMASSTEIFQTRNNSRSVSPLTHIRTILSITSCMPYLFMTFIRKSNNSKATLKSLDIMLWSSAIRCVLESIFHPCLTSSALIREAPS